MASIQIILPVYNTAPYIEQCFESLVRQTYTDWEAIVIDDCSADGISPSMCDAWAARDERFKVYHLPENRGISAVRNFGLSQVTAPLVGFVDSDDFITEEHLASLAAVLSNTDADIAMCGHIICSHKGRELKKKQIMPSSASLEHPMLLVRALEDRKLTSHLWSKLFRRALFESIEFPKRRYYEDFPVVPRLVNAAKKLVHTGKATYCYRKTPAGITHTTTPLHVFNFFEGCLERLALLCSTDLVDDYTAAALSVWPRKAILQQWKKISSLPETVERNELRARMLKEMRRLGIAPVEVHYPFQMIALSLQKRYFERVFRKRKSKK